MSEQPKFSREDYLQHIAEAAALILEYTRGMSKEAFLGDRKTQQAVLMNIMVIGEAAALLRNEHADFLAHHSEIEWEKMRGMRNVTAHKYWSINLDIVWETVARSIPDLHSNMRALIDDASHGAGEGSSASQPETWLLRAPGDGVGKSRCFLCFRGSMTARR